MDTEQIQRFTVIDELGSGGMGTVYRVHDPQLQREVAIKVLAHPAAYATRRLSVHDTVCLRHTVRGSGVDLLSEARMMARLSHPNVLPVYEVGLAEGGLFVVMEHIDGCDLSRWLETPRSADEVLHVLAQAGRGLAAAHFRGIVHRDFKPENVLVGKDRRVRVADFGLSQLVGDRHRRFVGTVDTSGTPGYMAPELVQGAPATPASDVYAFAVVIAEALGAPLGATAEERERRLRERGTPTRLRAAIALGLALEPHARCSLDVLLAALEPARSQPKRWVVVAAVAAIVISCVAIAAPAGAARRSAACDPAMAVRSTWDPIRRTRMVLQLARTRGDFEMIQRIAAILDRKDRAITSMADATRRAEQAGDLTHVQATVRQSCLARRRFELTSVVDHTLARHEPLDAARARVLQVADPDRCLELTAAPLPSKLLATRRLYARWVASWDVDQPADGEVATLEKLANRNGDRELAVRAALSLARRLIARDDLEAGEAAAQRAYRGAMEIRAFELAASALVERSRLASLRGDGTAAANFAQLAKDLVDKPTTSKRSRAKVYSALGRAHSDLGDYGQAIDELERGLSLVDRGGGNEDLEVSIRIAYVYALATAERGQVAVDVAKQSVERIDKLVGERDANYGIALNMLAYALRWNSDLENALPIRKRALAVLLAALPADDSHVMLERADLADDLTALGEFELARKEYAAVLAASERSPTLKGKRVPILSAYAVATFDGGHFAEGARLQEQAYEESLAQFGIDHPWTLTVLSNGIEFALEQSDVARAEHQLDLLLAGYAKRPALALSAATARGVLGADVALLRGKPRVAEKLAREALRVCTRAGARDSQLLDIYYELGQSLRVQREFSTAREAMQTSRELAIRTQAPADTLAAIDVELAALDAAVGHDAVAYARAKSARLVLDKFPGRLRVRAQADALLARIRRQ